MTWNKQNKILCCGKVRQMKNNILLIDKEAGWTSNDVVRFLKGKLNPVKKVLKQNEKRFRIGHAGTLDPFATGLLLIMLNDGTKQFDELQKLKKEYVVEIEFGKKTDTQDVTGKVVWEYDEAENGEINLKNLSQDKLFSTLEKFRGKIWQVPPKYSALKIGGKPVYKLAYKLAKNTATPSKEGELLEKIMEEKKREVEVYESEILKIEKKVLTVRFVVSSGTYIRTLAQDIGDLLGFGAFAKSLRRTKIGKYKVEDAKKKEEF